MSAPAYLGDYDLFAFRAGLHPDRRAVRFEGRWLSYGELNRRASRLAGRLHAAGIRPGDRVSLLAHNHLAHLLLHGATAKHGFVYAPLNTRLAPPELRHVARELTPRLVLHDAEHAKGAAAVADASGASTLDLNDLDSFIGDPDPAPAPELTPESPQAILLTGGTTGHPKGAVQPYRMGHANALATIAAWGVHEDDLAIQATPCFHAAVNALTVPLLAAGAAVDLPRRFDPGRYLQDAQDLGATVLFLVPTMFRMLIDHHDFAQADFRAVRFAISGGAPCPSAVRAAFLAKGVPFRQGYGLTEAGVNDFVIRQEDADRHPDAVGRPMLGTRARIVAPDGSDIPDGEVGELCLAGPHLFSGYFGRDEDTAEVLRDDWLWTGDLAVRGEDGLYRIVGRRKEMFVSGGENVYPAAVERTLEAHPDVHAAAVVGVPDPIWGEVGLAAYVPSAGSDPDEQALRAWLREQLARYAVPKHWRRMNALPLTGAGKVAKTRLQRDFEEEQA